MPSLRLAAIAIAISMLGSPAGAQDRAGRNTPGEWKVTHFQPFGLWETICDERTTDAVLERRCYVRYVEVYSPKPKFGAVFAFIVPDGREGAVRFDFGFEQGTRFARNGFRIDGAGGTAWTLPGPECDGGGNCAFTAEDATGLEDVIRATEAPVFAFDFRDRYARKISLRWDSSGLGAALDDMRAEARERALID